MFALILHFSSGIHYGPLLDTGYGFNGSCDLVWLFLHAKLGSCMSNEQRFTSVCLMARTCQQGVMLQTLNCSGDKLFCRNTYFGEPAVQKGSSKYRFWPSVRYCVWYACFLDHGGFPQYLCNSIIYIFHSPALLSHITPPKFQLSQSLPCENIFVLGAW